MKTGGERRSLKAVAWVANIAMFASTWVIVGPSTALAAVDQFPDGTEVEVTIDSPDDGSSPIDGSVDLVGTARVGAGQTPADTSLVVVYDLSGSTLDPAGGDCGGDTNGDGRSNTILDCEVAAMEALEQTAEALGSVAEMGVVLFELGSAAADVQPASGVQRLTAPGADLNNNGVTDIAEVVRTSRWRGRFFSADATVDLFTRFDAGTGRGGTNYSAGLSRACETLAATSQPNRTIVFLSDGGANRGSDVTTALPCGQPATVFSVAVGANSTCANDPSGLGSLQEVADLTGGTCTEVVSPEDLPDILSGILAPEIYALELSVNGGPPIDISSQASVALPAKGPDPIDWTFTVDGLTGPVDEICVTVFARRDAELVDATECIELVSDRPPVADAGGDRTVPEGSLVQLDGTGSFDPDDDPLSYEWEVIAQDGSPVIFTSTTEPIASFIAFDDGTYDVQLTVSDGRSQASDDVTIVVENQDPVLSVLAEPASEGGVALVTANFTDPGLLDTHTATIDWGDGTVEPLDISAQGNGWGSMYAAHVYGESGSFTATITVVDDDGGIDAAESVSVEVSPSLAIWANSETARRTIDWRGGSGSIDGLVHTNNELRVRGNSKAIAGAVEFVGSVSAPNGTLVSGPAVQVAPSDPPIVFDLADYRPGGRAATDAGDTYNDMSAECGRRWDPTGPLEPGLYYVPCDVKLNSSALTGDITVVAEGTIQVSGSAAAYSPFIDGLLFLSGSSSTGAVQISASDGTFLGYLQALDGRIDLAGSDNTYLCGIVADRVDITGSGLEVRASDCVRPERTAAPPTLVPDLVVDVAVDPSEVLPGDAATTRTTLTNDGALLLVPGIVGVENLGEAPVTVDDMVLGIEYLTPAGEWLPVPGTTTIDASPNAASGVAFDSVTNPFGPTVVDPGGLATWAAEIQIELDAAAVALLMDPTQTLAVRNVASALLTNPTNEPVRDLFRFGTDLAPELRAQTGDLIDVDVVSTAIDGSAEIVTAADVPALSLLGPGDSVIVERTAEVAVPELRGVIEPVDAYLARLSSLDGTELSGSAFALGSGGVGTVLGPFAFDSTVRRVPIVSAELDGSEALVAGDVAEYEAEVRNLGSAEASSIDTTLDVDGTDVPVVGPASLVAGAIEQFSASTAIPDDRPVGTFAAELSVGWSDANGNVYGRVDDSVVTDVGTPPDLAALLADSIFVDADSSGVPSAGDTIRYAATITNRGTTSATDVVATFPVDARSVLSVGSVTTSVGTVATGNGPGDGIVVVDVGSLEAMTSAEIVFDVVISTGADSLSVQGVVSSSLPDVLTDDPGASGPVDPTVTTVVETPPNLQAVLVVQLAIDADGDGFPTPGDTLDYALQVTNAGLTSATAVTATVDIDANTTLVGDSVSTSLGTVVEGASPTDSRVVVAWDSVAGLSQVDVEYSVVIDDPLPAGTDEVTSQGVIASNELADVVTDDPTVGGTSDPTTIAVATTTGGGGGPGGGGPGGPGGPGGGPAPEFGTVGPENGTVVTTPIEVEASATPPDGTTIESWQVVAYPTSGDPTQGIVLGGGIGELPAEPLATFDPTVVSNGGWVIRVEATDSDGGVGFTETIVTVEGNLKLGNYALTYLDSDVSVGGVPLRVNRTYDTLRRTQSDDFGYGWSLDVANFEVSTNRPLGEGPWSSEVCGGGFIFVPICWTPETPRTVSVTWPSGRVERFDLEPTGNTFLSILVSANYEARDGATSELRPAPGTETAWLANGNIVDGFFGAGGDVYDPQRFVLIGDDGTEYLLDRDTGLISATDRYGNTVTYTDDGIVSSLGPSLTFVRDAEGRIIELVEPSGNTLTYTYDAAGDLVSVLDQSGSETTFVYENGHYLSAIDDAGAGPFRRLEYGPDGRLAAVIDGEGNRTEVSVDVDDRSQIVTSPDGLSTRITSFDERGNATEIDTVYDGESHLDLLTYDEGDRVTSRIDPLGNQWTLDYDASGNLTRFVEPDGDTYIYTYGAFNQPTAITDAEGNTRTFAYDSVGNLTRVNHPAGATSGGPNAVDIYTHDAAGNVRSRTDSAGNVWEWTWNGDGRLTSASDPLGNTMSYTYDGDGRVTSQTDGTGATTNYVYDEVGNLTSVTDANGAVMSYVYDERDQIVQSIDPAGEVTSFEYDDVGNLVSETNPLDEIWTYDYEFNRLVSWTAPDGAIWTQTYDAAGRLASLTDPVGRTETYGYDDAGRWTATTFPWGEGQSASVTYTLDGEGNEIGTTDVLGGTWNYEYNGNDQVTSITDPLGAVVSTTYDALGRSTGQTDQLGRTTAYGYDVLSNLTTVTSADGAVTTYEHDPVGNVIAVTDPIGRTVGYVYDEAYRRIGVEDPNGDTATTRYDPVGQVVEEVTAAGVRSEYAYDVRGALTSVTDGIGSVRTFAYDDVGRLVSTTDPRGHTTSYEFDPMGRPTRTIDQLSGSATREYDLAGQLTAVVDPVGGRRSFAYDSAGRLISSGDGLGRSWSYENDAMGRRTRSVDPRGVALDYTYDALGRLVSEVSPNESVSFGYDAAGQRLTMTDATGLTTWSYDTVGRVELVVAPGGPVAYDYDLAGQVVSMTQPEGVTSYTYDPRGTVASVTDLLGNLTAVEVDADGRTTRLERPNGLVTEHAYDTAGRLTGVNHRNGAAVVSGYEYVLDPNGNRVSAAINEPEGGRVESYVYDELDRLLSVDYGDGVSESFTYDAVGNRTSQTVVGGPNAGTTTYAFDVAQQLVSANGPASSSALSYDSSGNLLDNGSGTTHTWDDRGRLASTTSTGSTTLFTHDGDGVRTGVGDTTHLWDRRGLDRLISDGTNSYTHLGNQVVSSITGGSADQYLWDGLGSIRTITDTAGAVTASRSYDVDGVVRSSSGAFGQFGFTGQWEDPGGQLYLRARSYDPLSGRFLSADSLQPNAAGTTGWNLYGYGNANPTTYIDPTGNVASIEYATLARRTSIVAATAVRLLGLCIKGIVEGIAFGLALAGILGTEFRIDGWLLVDCALEILFAGFGPPSGGGGRGGGGPGGSGGAGGGGRGGGGPGGGSAAGGGSGAGGAGGRGGGRGGSNSPPGTGGGAGGGRNGGPNGGRNGGPNTGGNPPGPSVGPNGPRTGAGNQVTGRPASSSTLGSNLARSGVNRPPNSAAHHIVAGGAKRAAQARATLSRFGIDINLAANGVFLPANRASPNPTGASVHSTLHTNQYYARVNQLLGQASTRQEALDALDYIRGELLAGRTL